MGVGGGGGGGSRVHTELVMMIHPYWRTDTIQMLRLETTLCTVLPSLRDGAPPLCHPPLLCCPPLTVVCLYLLSTPADQPVHPAAAGRDSGGAGAGVLRRCAGPQPQVRRGVQGQRHHVGSLLFGVEWGGGVGVGGGGGGGGWAHRVGAHAPVHGSGHCLCLVLHLWSLWEGDIRQAGHT
jgi:hypothetical protein